MWKIVLAVIVFFACCPLLSAKEVNSSMCASYINTYCTRCHTKERICTGLKTNDAQGWHRVIIKMAGNDADIDKDVQDVVYTCLTSLPSVTDIVCPQK